MHDTAAHDLPSKTADCISKPILLLFDAKFILARTKCEAVNVNILVLMPIEKLKNLKRTNFTTLSTDVSNRKDKKKFPFTLAAARGERK
jgi:hypothetical protein